MLLLYSVCILLFFVMTTIPSVISVKIDPKVKQQAQVVAKQLGISLSGIINAYLRQLIQTKEIHFSCGEELPNKKTEIILNEINRDIQKGKNLGKTYTSKNILEAFPDSQ